MSMEVESLERLKSRRRDAASQRARQFGRQRARQQVSSSPAGRCRRQRLRWPAVELGLAEADAIEHLGQPADGVVRGRAGRNASELAELQRRQVPRAVDPVAGEQLSRSS